jgi:hypothetical protein
MFLRISSAKRNGKTYEYAQLVESVRRDSDGRPYHRIVANLGRITDRAQADNLRAAFEANRTGRRLVAVSEPAVSEYGSFSQPRACLRYLDAAVVLETLGALGIRQELQRLLPPGQHDVGPEKVVAALVVQRCLDPQSKLHAVRWFPRTALPELLEIEPEQFNNTRVHRALEMLENIEQDVVRCVSRLCAEKRGPFKVAFLDLTDTYFEGSGPELAALGKSKEGLIRKKIGIALLCSPTGLPLRWQVVAGNRAEAPTMLEMMRQVQLTPWLANTPLVVDRAMGFTAHIHKMLQTDVRFITALTTAEYETYCPQLPAQKLLDLGVASEEQEAACATEAARRIEGLGFERLADNLFCLDVGIIGLPTHKRARRKSKRVAPSLAMQFARDLEQAVGSGQFGSYAAAGRSMGHAKGRTHWHRELLKLPEDLQQLVLAGEVDAISIWEIVRVGRLTESECRAAFSLLQQLHRQAPRDNAVLPAEPVVNTETATLRCAAYFNPEMFASQRRLAAGTLAALQGYVQTLNDQLMHATARTKAASVRQKVEHRLRRSDLVSAFNVEVVETCVGGKSYLKVKLTVNEAQWQRRQRFDGFTVIVADSRVQMTAQQLCQTYRAKDAVETDFQVIKSLIRLRPVRHHTDLKVRAHVTLCMLALLVERTLHQALRPKLSARSAFELLEPCRLTVHQASRRSRPTYVLTHPSDPQLRILRKVRLTRLADGHDLQGALTPRSSFVTTDGEETS